MRRTRRRLSVAEVVEVGSNSQGSAQGRADSAVEPAAEYPVGMQSGVPSWDEYFLDICRTASRRSKDPNTKLGAVIV